MNEPIAWLDGILAAIVFPLGFLILMYIFRSDTKKVNHQ
jgi:hypothetical protein